MILPLKAMRKMTPKISQNRKRNYKELSFVGMDWVKCEFFFTTNILCNIYFRIKRNKIMCVCLCGGKVSSFQSGFKPVKS